MRKINLNYVIMMKKQYDPQEIEEQAQQFWRRHKSFEVAEDDSREKYYCLSMFPYPSGQLHMGHVRNYTIGDTISRFQRMQGKNVLQPMGWDAFGLPAENAALKHKVSPAKWTYDNIDYMRAQFKRLGFAFDWSRELATCKAEYYRWEQWFFSQLFAKGLVYKKKSAVNWCENDQTVLANEQVVDGCCWRCDGPVVQKEIAQWFVRITAYAEELLDDLEKLEGWPLQVKTMQKNWIGRSEGLEIDFLLLNSARKLTVYTTRVDTLIGVTYLAIAHDHPLALEAGKDDPNVASFSEECKRVKLTEADQALLDKRGVKTDLQAEHPITGRELPIYVTNFVLREYGTGAVMAVPAHDARDFEFAMQHDLEVVRVIRPCESDTPSVLPFTGTGLLCNSGVFDGLSSKDAKGRLSDTLIEEGKARKRVHYRLRDWGISRQRYWGAPIPMLQLEDGSQVPALEFPVLLPAGDLQEKGLAAYPDWAETQYKGQHAQRETDTFDTFMESSWYYARFCSPRSANAMVEKSKADYWLPVDQYIGGIEHAVMHLLYARFMHKLLRDCGLLSTSEPFKRLLCQGMVLADAFYYVDDKGDKIWVNSQQVQITRDAKGKICAAVDDAGHKLCHVGMIKMSKSKNNGIDPQQMIERYGADTVRLFTMFAAPPAQTLEWQEAGVEGALRFLRKYWKLVFEHLNASAHIVLDSFEMLDSKQRALRFKTHDTIAKVSNEYAERHGFNTAIARVMELFNSIVKYIPKNGKDFAVVREAIESMTLLLAPIVPHITHCVWLALGKKQAVIDTPWPEVDSQALEQETLTLVVQVNGKVRAKLCVGKEEATSAIQTKALKNPQVIRAVDGKTVQKIIVVPGRLVNVVVP